MRRADGEGAGPGAGDGAWPWPRWAWLLPAAAVLPFAALLPLAFPQLDDYCFGGKWQELGLVGMLEFFYRTFVGRLFSNTVIALPFALSGATGIDLFVVYRALCALVFLAAVALAAWTVPTVMPQLRGARSAFVTLALLGAMVGGAPSPNDLYFWISQVGNYTLAAIAAFAIMIAMWRAAEDGRALSPPAIGAIAVVGFLTAMATEMSGAILFIIVAGAGLRRWLQPGAPRQIAAHLLMLAAFVAGAAIVAAAPGNAARMSVYGQSHGLIASAIGAVPMAIVRLLNHLYLRAVSPALVAWPIVVALATWHTGRTPRTATPRSPALVVWLPLATAIAATGAALWIGQTGMGQFLPPRARGHLHFVLLAGLTLTTIEATRAYGDRVIALSARRWPKLAERHVAMLALLLTIAAPHAIHAALTLTLQRPALGAAIAERHATLEAARGRQGTIHLPPLPLVWPVVIGDIDHDPAGWPNACLAGYYGLGSVRLSGS